MKMNGDIDMKIRGFEIVIDEKRKHPGAEVQMPTRGSKHSIAYDLYSPIDIVIKPSEKELIWTDIKSYFQQGEALLLNVRSSMGSHPVIMGNVQGWVECDYYGNPKNDGNLGINLLNLGTEPYVIKKGDRIAQAMFIPFLVSDNCNSDEERIGGFGSTGK
ncbi:MAG: dUTP diphosphatase [Clostridium sp.]|uniref:dUTP diphosphatase n=1 Tax=Clostridium sp. TaxID=1506 RepID=UPI00304D7C1F